MLPRATAVLWAIVLIGFPAAANAAAAGDGAEAREEVVQLLHDGRFEEAEDRLADGSLVPAGADRDFFRALVLYWRLLYDEHSAPLKSAFDNRLEAALLSSEARLEASPRDPDALLWNGTARLFLAELRASQKRPFAAAKEARRARNALSSARGVDPTLADASFGLGTVDVLADELPALAKGLGSFLGLSGDRERGLRGLELAAGKGRFFALEARLFLLTVRSSRKKRVYAGALEEANRVSSSMPRSVAALDGAARVRISLGDAAKAAAELDAALAIAARAPRTDRGVIATLVVQRARAELALFRPDLAIDWLHRLVPMRPAIPAEVLKDAAEVARVAAEALPVTAALAELAAASGNEPPSPEGAAAGTDPSSWRRAIPALELERGGNAADSAAGLDQLASESPDDAILAMLAGRAALLAGRAAPARSWLTRAASSPHLPKAWLGPCLLLDGRAADLAGDRAAAIALYRRAAAAPAFAEKEAAWLHLGVPYRGPS